MSWGPALFRTVMKSTRRSGKPQPEVQRAGRPKICPDSGSQGSEADEHLEHGPRRITNRIPSHHKSVGGIEFRQIRAVRSQIRQCFVRTHPPPIKDMARLRSGGAYPSPTRDPRPMASEAIAPELRRTPTWQTRWTRYRRRTALAAKRFASLLEGSVQTPRLGGPNISRYIRSGKRRQVYARRRDPTVVKSGDTLRNIPT